MKTKPLSSNEREQLAVIVGQVFTLIQRTYPRTWETSWAGPAEVQESQKFIWKHLQKSGLLPTTAGLERLETMMMDREGDFPPSLPDIVRSLKPVPQDYGYLSSDDAFQLLLKNSHQPEAIGCPAIKVAMKGLVFDLRNAGAKEVPKIRKSFIAAYSGAINRVMFGEDLRAVVALEHQKPAPGNNRAHPKVEANIARLTTEQKSACAKGGADVLNNLKAMLGVA